MPERQTLVPVPGCLLGTRVKEDRPAVFGIELPVEVKPLELARVQSFRHFYLVGDDVTSLFLQKIDLVARVVPEKIQGRPLDVVEFPLDLLRDDKVFKKHPPKRMRLHVLDLPDVQKIRSKSHVAEVKLGSFNDSFSEIPVMRPEQTYNVARFENGNPRLHGIYADADIVRHAGHVEHLAHVGGAKPQKILEPDQVPDFLYLSQVSLNIRIDVERKRLGGVQLLVYYSRVESPVNQVFV